MSRLRLIPVTLLAGGGAVLLTALLWWYVIFGNIVAEGFGSYRQAVPCLWGTSGYTCQLMLSLCTTEYSVIPKAYRPELFRAGAILLLAGAAFALWRRQSGPVHG